MTIIVPKPHIKVSMLYADNLFCMCSMHSLLNNPVTVTSDCVRRKKWTRSVFYNFVLFFPCILRVSSFFHKVFIRSLTWWEKNQSWNIWSLWVHVIIILVRLKFSYDSINKLDWHRHTNITWDKSWYIHDDMYHIY